MFINRCLIFKHSSFLSNCTSVFLVPYEHPSSMVVVLCFVAVFHVAVLLKTKMPFGIRNGTKDPVATFMYNMMESAFGFLEDSLKG